LAGAWHFQSNCPFDTGTDVTLTEINPSQYRVVGTGGMLATPFAGWVSGKLVHMEANPPLNHVVFDGSVISPTTMQGDVSLAIGPHCGFIGQKK
jgi:hypothetical protein